MDEVRSERVASLMAGVEEQQAPVVQWDADVAKLNAEVAQQNAKVAKQNVLVANKNASVAHQNARLRAFLEAQVKIIMKDSASSSDSAFYNGSDPTIVTNDTLLSSEAKDVSSEALRETLTSSVIVPGSDTLTPLSSETFVGTLPNSEPLLCSETVPGSETLNSLSSETFVGTLLDAATVLNAATVRDGKVFGIDSNFKKPKNKTNEQWCDHHKYQKTHVTENCRFLNKLKKKKIIKQSKQAQTTNVCYETVDPDIYFG